jgi:hypothetical protein
MSEAGTAAWLGRARAIEVQETPRSVLLAKPMSV